MKLDITRWRGSVIKSGTDFFFMSFQPRVTELDDAVFSLADESPSGTPPREILRLLRERAQAKAREHGISYVSNLDQAPVEIPPVLLTKVVAQPSAPAATSAPALENLDDPFFSSPAKSP